MTIEDMLQAHIKRDEEAIKDIRDDLTDAKESREELHAEVRKMSEEFSRYKGFIGGVVFVISALAAAIGLAIAWFSK